MEIVVTPEAQEDLAELPVHVSETFYSKKKDAEKNLALGASPEQAFNKRLSGNMHPVLQMNLGRDYRAWFLESKYLKTGDTEIFCFKVMTKKEAEKLADSIPDALAYFEPSV